MGSESWRIEMLGGFCARRDGRVVTRFESRKAASLLAYLAYHPGRAHSREVIAEILWPDEDPEATRTRLRTVLTDLRRILEGGNAAAGTVLLADRATVQLAPSAVTTDVAEFEAALQQARAVDPRGARLPHLERAVGLYHGELLPGYYDDWIGPERDRLADAYLDALSELSDLRAASGDMTGAIAGARRALAADPLRETVHCQLMRLYAQAGRRPEALRQYRELARILKDELDAEPSSATQALAREIDAGFRIADSGAPWALRNGEQTTDDRRPTTRLSGRSEQSAISNQQSSISNLPSSFAVGGASFPPPDLPPPGGALPLDSPYYVERHTDAEFQRSILQQDSIVLVKGPRQVGKTSLLARGLQQAREAGAVVTLTDLQKLTTAQLATADSLLFALSETIAEQLELDVAVSTLWDPRRAFTANFERFLTREVLARTGAPLVWGLDEVDRLFNYPFASEVFGLFRSWHNERALRPAAPWARVTLAIAYATEAALFITDLHQSPFNVGTRLELEDFTVEQVADLNHRYAAHSGSGRRPPGGLGPHFRSAQVTGGLGPQVPSGHGRPPLANHTEVERYFRLVGGHPYLVQCGLHRMVRDGLRITAIEEQATLEHGPFGDHLRRLLHSLSRDPDLRAAAHEALRLGRCSNPESFYRLRSAGVLLGDTAAAVRPRCRLYRLYLEAHLD